MALKFRLPEGWTLEPLFGGQLLLKTPPPQCYMATIDFRLRGFRSGLVQSGKFEGEKLTKRGLERKQYTGLGWMQVLIDDAVAHLRKIL